MNDFNKMAGGDNIEFCEVFDSPFLKDRKMKFYVLGWTMEDLKPLEYGGECMMFNKGVLADDRVLRELFLKMDVIDGDSLAASRLFTYPSPNIVEWNAHPIQFFGSGKDIVMPRTKGEDLRNVLGAGECGVYSFQMTKVDTGDTIHIVITEPDAADYLKKVLFANKLCPDGDYSDFCWEYGRKDLPEDQKCEGIGVCVYNNILECVPDCWDAGLTDEEVQERLVFDYNQRAQEYETYLKLPEYEVKPISAPIIAGDEQELPTSPFTPQT